jgi:signal transduction histidine kinase
LKNQIADRLWGYRLGLLGLLLSGALVFAAAAETGGVDEAADSASEVAVDEPVIAGAEELVPTPAPPLEPLSDNDGVGRFVIVAPVHDTIELGLAPFIQRVLENLVRNAIRFTPAGGEVTISIAERPESVAVAVSDTGPGIPDKDIPRIFDRFYCSQQGEQAGEDSSGLGLAIVKRILDLHESRITVVSKIDAGTRFEFELPLYDQAA